MMRERIKMIMDSENLSPAQFADKLQIGRAVISHILNGRNNPSLDVITKILMTIPHINSQWLITGEGNMYREDYGEKNDRSENHPDEKASPDLFESDLFSQKALETDGDKEKIKYVKEKELKQPLNDTQETVIQSVIYKEKAEKKVSKIIIYYTDNTFESFNPE